MARTWRIHLQGDDAAVYPVRRETGLQGEKQWLVIYVTTLITIKYINFIYRYLKRFPTYYDKVKIHKKILK